MRVLVGVGTMGGATMVTMSSLVRQSVTRELPEMQVDGEEASLARLQEEGWCVMKEALPASQLAESLGSFRRGVEAGGSSDLQLLFSLPNSGDQIFHQDNSHPGLTVLVPLVDMNLENGPTQLLPRSHLDVSLGDRLKDSSAALPACVPAGTALIYDSRTIHRGLANPSKVSRPVLVYRYDYPATPPPGHTPLSTLLYSFLGALLCAIGEAKLLLEYQ